MATVAEALAQAWTSHQAGNLSQAEQGYRQVLQADPGQAQAWFLLAAACQGQGRLAEAVEHYRQAVSLAPGHAEAHNNLGVALASLGRTAEAIPCFLRAVRLRPDYAEAHGNLGGAYGACGKADEAVASLRQALRYRPDSAGAHVNLANALASQGKLDDARDSCRMALRLQPNLAEAHNSLGNILTRQGKPREAVAALQQALRIRPNHPDSHLNLGIALAEQGKLDEAVACYREALRHRPAYPEAHYNVGNAYRSGRQFEQAAGCYEEALRLRPDYAEAHNNLANALTDLGRLDEAHQHLQAARRLKPDHMESLCSLGVVLRRLGRVDEAVRCYEDVLRRELEHVEAHNNLAVNLLVRGDYARGWAEYEWRWRLKENRPRSFTQPVWHGEELTGRTILLHAEQGLGDTLQFIRYAALVKELGGTVVVECPPALLPLLTACPGIDRLVGRGGPLPPFDVHAPLLSVPRVLGTTLATVPGNVPYLFADPRLIEHWRGELGPTDACRVGVVWRGNPTSPYDRYRSFPLKQLVPLARLAGVRLYSLQKGPHADELREAAALFPVVDLGPRLDESAGAFMDTAAVMKNLDLVIVCDSANGHLAGGLGVPTWIPMPYAPDWRWLLDRDDSPWYPTVRLFRQTRLYRWDDVFERMAEAVRSLLATRPRPSLLAEIAPGELIDKISILEIKKERIKDPAKLANVHRELDALEAVRRRGVPTRPELDKVAAELKGVNEALWEVEDALRLCEQAQDFGPRFVDLARSVYKHNDRRAALKRRINELLGSAVVEEKSYTVVEELQGDSRP